MKGYMTRGGEVNVQYRVNNTINLTNITILDEN